MYFVEFPKLNLGFNINPVAFSIGNFNIYWYGIIISIAFLVSFLYAILNVKRFKIDQDKFIDCVIVGLIAGIIGARLFYVLFYPGDTYIKNPISVFYLHEGGLAIYGGIICGLLGGGLMAKHKKLNVLACLDVASISFLIGQSIGRWGNFINQEAFGGPTNLPWGMVSRNTAYVSSGPVHPCFLYESIWCIIGFFILNWFSKKYRKYDGEMFLMYMVWYGIGRCFIEQLRSDSLLIPMTSLPISQVISILCVIIGLALLIYFYAMQNPESKLGQWLSKFTSNEIQIKEKESQENIDIENKLLEDEPTVESKPESTNVESKETNDEKSAVKKEIAKNISESVPKEISNEKPATKKRTTKRASSTKSEPKETSDKKPTTKKTSANKANPEEASDEKLVAKKRTTKKASSTKSEPKETSDEKPTTKKRKTTKKASTAKANPEEASDGKLVTKKRTTKKASSTKSESKEDLDENPTTKKGTTTKKVSTSKAESQETSDEKPATKKRTTKRTSSTSSKSTIDKKEKDSQQDSENSQQK